jgi:hypothetical protein
VYYLYTQYGFDKGDIGRLFIAGFGSSMLFGTVVGSLADKQYARRRASFPSINAISWLHFTVNLMASLINQSMYLAAGAARGPASPTASPTSSAA